MSYDEFWSGCDDCTVLGQVFLEEQRDADIPSNTILGYSRKKKQRGWGHTFLPAPPPTFPGIFRFFTLPMEIADKKRLHS